MNIIDCTIRDGSYATNYNWNKEDLKKIVSTLSKNGIRYIEIGNGTGLGAFRKLREALSDQEYFKNTIPFKGNSLIGAFFIPGIGTKEDILVFREAGGDFIRIGANATEMYKTYDYITFAKSLGLKVFSNLMKTYAISTYQLIMYAQSLVELGVDGIYVVDSAGGMLPKQISRMVKAIKSFYDIPIGFHGHNNLLMANANSLAAIESGADYVDATLGGLGRGAGNAQLESLIAIFQKAGLMDNNISVFELSDLSHQTIGLNYCDLIKGSSKREITEGTTNFHSSYTDLLEKTAKKYRVNAELLMQEVCKINIIDPSEELFEMAAANILAGKDGRIFAPKFYHKKY